ncbi:MAG: hypothetical protein GTO40_01765 [Deltaproteobacteria bacterium]|nr:hypothetical protein [Deltaproteobacteria bacterium]
MIRINLLPVRELKAEVARRQELTIGVMCFVLLGIVMGAFHIIQSSRLSANEKELASLQQEIKTLNSRAKGVTNLKKNIGILKQKLKVIDELGKRKTGPAKVMESLSDAMPPRLWLTEFKESGGNLSISGMAVDNQTIAGFLKALSSSPYFQNVELGETTQVEQKSQPTLKKFALRSRLLYRLPDPPSANNSKRRPARNQRRRR